MSPKALLASLLATAIMVTVYAVAIGALFTKSTEQLKPLEREPYGGCDEAYLYPGTEGAEWCAEHRLP